MKASIKFSLFVLLLFVCKIQAQCENSYGTIKISEIYFDTRYNELIQTKYHSFGEYIELFNSSNEAVDLNGWIVRDNHTAFLISNNDYLGNNTIIQPGGFKVITYNSFYAGGYGLPSAIGGRQKFKELFGFPADLSNDDIILQDRMVLYNDVDIVRIYTPQNKLIDEVSYLNESTSKPNPKSYLNIQSYNLIINPRIDNDSGGLFNGPIGLVSIYISFPFPGHWEEIQTTQYSDAIFRSSVNDYYSDGATTFQVATATPLSLPIGMSVPLKSLDPFLYYIPSNQVSNQAEIIEYDLKNNLTKVSHSKTYFDDLGRPNVSLSKDFVSGKIWGNETLYDNFGRKSKESFPTTSCLGLDKVNFLSNSIAKANFLDKYYNDNNTLERYQANAELTFNEIKYDVLNPGNIINEVGGNKIETSPGNYEWKTGFSYTMPAAQEMYYFYGHSFFKGEVTGALEEVVANYYKTVSIDPNGIEMVSFIDADGKILASANSGIGSPLSYRVYSLIGTQGFIDIHIPVGVPDGNLLGSPNLYDVFDLKSGMLVNTNGTLPAGNLYRVVAKTIPLIDPKVYINQSNGSISYDPNAIGISYYVNYYDYGINIYNSVGQLQRSVQPNGFQKVFPYSISITSAPSYMSNSNMNFATNYTYNSGGEVVTVSDSDEGTNNYSYRDDGQIRYSRSALQGYNKMSYTNYDINARPIESGVSDYSNAFIYPNDEQIIPINNRVEQLFTVYDYPENTLGLTALIPTSLSLNTLLTNRGLNPNNYKQNNLSGHVAVTYSKPATNITAITWFSYDIYSNVEWVVQYNEGLGIKTIHYEYDYNGNIQKVIYEKDSVNEYFAQKYTYDLNDKLVKAETSTSSTGLYTNQAEYSYYISGELKRVNVAQGLQGMDYVYTLGGMLKSINHPSLEASKDPGGDNNDIFGLTLDYYNGDYKRANSNLSTSPSISQDYSGNIKAARWSNKQLDVLNPLAAVGAGNSATQRGYVYNYDQNDYLTGATYGNVNSSNAIVSNNKYKEENITYDSNGNIKTLKRTNDNAALVDDFIYNYTDLSKNQLKSVSDAVTTADPSDIENQSLNNYVYDASGQLIRSVQDDLYYYYNTQGLVTSIWKGTSIPLVKFFYNERGQRIRKESFSNINPNQLINTDYYVIDLSGSVLAIYNKNGSSGSIVQTELPIYGIDRIGVYYKTANSVNYEITDHLGNIRAVIRKNLTTNLVSIQSYADYYPYGELLPGRSAISNFRYGFQGQEIDPETGLEAFLLRLWDGRIGRWLMPDPYGEFYSTYLGMGNNPINLIDPDGGATDPPVIQLKEVVVYGTRGHSTAFNIGRTALDFVPFAGSALDIYEGFRDGDGLQASLGVVFLVVDVATLGSGSIVKGGLKTLGKKAVEEAAEQGAKKLSQNYLRQKAVKQAWKQEKKLVKATGKGTRDWTEKEAKELLTNGKVQKYVGHHIKNVKHHPKLAGNPDNIKFLTRAEHYKVHNNGKWAQKTTGKLIQRKKL